jgi:hypothetical protein
VRIATLVIGLVLSIGLFIQSVTVGALSDAVNDEQDGAGGGAGMIMALIWVVACGLVIPLPRVSMVLFAVAGVIGVASAGPLDFPDLVVWGIISFVLAVFSFFGWRGKKKQQAKEAERDATLQQSLAAQQQMAAQLAHMQQQQAWQQQQGWQQQQQAYSQYGNQPQSTQN